LLKICFDAKVEIVTISLGIKRPQKLGQATGNLLHCAV